MFEIIRRIVFIGDIGRRDARHNYPSETDFIEVPLYEAEQTAGAVNTVGTKVAEALAPPSAAPAEPANDPHDLPKEKEA